MFIRDIDKHENAELYTNSQDVKAMLEELGCKEDYGGIFIIDGIAYGFDGSTPYLSLQLYEIGKWS